MKGKNANKQMQERALITHRASKEVVNLEGTRGF